MLITKNKSKSNGKTYINIVLKEDMIKSTKNPEYKKISVLAAIFGIPQPEKFKETIPANWKTMDPVDLKIYMTNKALEIYERRRRNCKESFMKYQLTKYWPRNWYKYLKKNLSINR